MVRVLIADACPLTLQGLKDLLVALENADVAGEAMTEQETLRLATEICPDIVFMDPDLNAGSSASSRDSGVLGIGVLRELKDLPRPPCVISYSAFNSVADVMALMLAGADGYVHKSTTPEQLAQDIESALEGEPPWRLGASSQEAQKRLVVASRVERLSNMEREVFELVLQNSDDEYIAQRLHVTSHTVKKHVSNILRKLEYPNRKAIFQG